MKECLNCKKVIKDERGTAKFCSANCRVKYHRKHGKKNEIKIYQAQVVLNEFKDVISEFKDMIKGGSINYAPITPDAYDGAKFDKITHDEPKQWQEPIKPIRQPKSVVKYIAERLELDTPDGYDKWLSELESDPYLSNKDKNLAKTGRLD